jgi:death-on-curing protein
MTRYLTVQQVLFIHARLIETTGGEHGVRDLGLLQSAVFRPQATFDGVELYGDLFDKAAALLISLAQNHPFVDGNKRTAITAAGLFLRQNGWRLATSSRELEQFALRIVDKGLDLKACANWLERHSVQVEQ